MSKKSKLIKKLIKVLKRRECVKVKVSKRYYNKVDPYADGG